MCIKNEHQKPLSGKNLRATIELDRGIGEPRTFEREIILDFDTQFRHIRFFVTRRNRAVEIRDASLPSANFDVEIGVFDARLDLDALAEMKFGL